MSEDVRDRVTFHSDKRINEFGFGPIKSEKGGDKRLLVLEFLDT